MIIDALLALVFEGLEALVELFPEGTVDLSGLHELDGYMSWVGLFIDLTFWAGVLSTIVAVEASLRVARVALWVWRLTPFSG